MNYPIEGACQCGGVTYRLLEAPLKVMACHCKGCQKLSTSAFSITAVIKASALECDGEMQEWRRTADSGNINAAMFCPTCGNRIYHFNPDDSGTLKFKPASLSDTRMIQPTAHIWVSEKQDWYPLPDDVDVFEKGPR